MTTPATEVSYNRPLQVGQVYGAQESPFYAEIAMIQFMEENGYNVTYISEVDTDSNPSALTGHKIFISSGHDEYWSANMRNNVEAALKSGVNLAFFSGNEDFWKTQYLPDPIDGTPERTLQTYKETHNEPPYGTSPNQYDPNDPPTWTGTWRDPEGAAPDDGDSPENSLTGQYFMVNSSGQNDDIDVPYQYAGLQVWKNTAVAKLTSSSAPVVLGANLGSLTGATTGFGTLGYEWDIDADNGFRPAGEIDMSSTTDNVTSSFVNDYGTVPTGNDTAETHHLTLYRASSGALVFGAGTVQFSWGLNNNNPMQNGSGASDPNMQQFVVNLFAMMGVQPATLIASLVPGAASTSTTPPTSTITSPVANSTLQDGTPTTITGTATDSSGGVVAGVEVSYDGGTTWHPTSIIGADSSSVTWTYSWQDAHGTPTATIETARHRRQRQHRDTHRRGVGQHRVQLRLFDLRLGLHPRLDRQWGYHGGHRRFEVHLDHVRYGQRRQVLQGIGQHRYPPGHAVDELRTTARLGHIHGRDRQRLAIGPLLHAHPRQSQYDLRGRLLRPQRP